MTRASRAAPLRQNTKLHSWLSQPVDGLALIIFRTCFGLLLAAGTLRFAAKGWIDELYLSPTFHFSYYGFSWLKPPPEPWIYLIFAATGLSALLVAAGVYYRAAVAALFFLFTAVELFDKALYLNHYYFVSWLTFLMLFLPLQRRDVRALSPRTNVRNRKRVPRWTVLALRLQVGLVYFFAGVAKLNRDWILEAQPLATWLPARATLPIVGPILDQTWTAFAMSWSGILFDLSIPFLLLINRTRLPAYIVLVIFHITTALLFDIGMFPWIMMASALVFFPGEELRSLPTRIGSAFLGEESPTPQPPTSQHRPLSTAGLALLIAFFVGQGLLPLRHWIYPGNVLWTEEGFRQSWRVMLVEKSGYATFRRLRSDHSEETIYPSDYLTAQQEHQMSFQPDMIQEFAHFLATQDGSRSQVRADVWVSLNGKPSQRLIDPTVDLAAEPIGLAPKTWILRRDPVEPSSVLTQQRSNGGHPSSLR